MTSLNAAGQAAIDSAQRSGAPFIDVTEENSRARVIIEGITPQIDCGRFPIKRIVGDRVVVEADVFADGHDVISCALLHRKEGAAEWNWSKMVPATPQNARNSDRFRGEFAVAEVGRYHYAVAAWVDPFKSWARDLGKRVAAGQDVRIDLQIGAELVAAAALRAPPTEAAVLRGHGDAMRQGDGDDTGDVARRALAPELGALMASFAERRYPTRSDRELMVVVDRERARFGAWYETFPRSCGAESGKHGTLRDLLRRLPYVAAMGFDVLYLPPIHPIGRDHRKGRNNSPVAGPDDPGSPWAIGGAEGGHKAVHPALGTLEDFRQLCVAAQKHDLEVALDLAFQCAPDHPYVREHPGWFRWRPDGTVQYAENPPKKYEDIYPFDFECADWRALWNELRDVVRFWIEQGVRIFRVDNPHTKPFPFWEWLIGDIKGSWPEVLFLAEAFTRPKVMHRLAKLGFSQSYTYFTWRNTAAELTGYLSELSRGPGSDYLRPNLWPNTPDILSEYLQLGGRPAFAARLVLAATLGASYGIYGPAFELCDPIAVGPGKEEYLDSEKYQLRQHGPEELNRPDSLAPLIARINRIRRDNPALQRDDGLRFHPASDDQLLAFTKVFSQGADSGAGAAGTGGGASEMTHIVLVIVNLDPHHAHAGWIELPLEELGLEAAQPYQVHDLLSDARYLWHGARNYVALDPAVMPAHIFRLRRRVRTERDFEYFL